MENEIDLLQQELKKILKQLQEETRSEEHTSELQSH